jgi:hypothetical protein
MYNTALFQSWYAQSKCIYEVFKKDDRRFSRYWFSCFLNWYSAMLNTALFIHSSKHDLFNNDMCPSALHNILLPALHKNTLSLCTLRYSALHKITLVFYTLRYSALQKTLLFSALCDIPHCTKNTLVLCTHHNWHSALHVVFLNSPEQRLCTCSYWASFMKRNSCLPLCYLSFSDQVERTLRVRGDLHIGGVMIHLVDSLGKSAPN